MAWSTAVNERPTRAAAELTVMRGAPGSARSSRSVAESARTAPSALRQSCWSAWVLALRRAGLGGDTEQVGVNTEEVGEDALRSGQRSEAGRDRRLHNVLGLLVEGVLIALPCAVPGQPGQVERPQIARCEFRAGMA
jgi:hypothetical protein